MSPRADIAPRQLARYKYASSYCEENIWQLCGEPRVIEGAHAVTVAVVSSPARACAFWAHRASAGSGGVVVWDYHVLLLRRGDATWETWDLDSTLGLPIDARRYLAETFRPLPPGASRLAPRFRLIDARTYRERFSSDRSHMIDADGRWRAPPPPWPPIHRPEERSFLEWVRMGEDDEDLLDLPALRSLLGC